jgi:selenocysteine lyase/cysteine desulfurase
MQRRSFLKDAGLILTAATILPKISHSESIHNAPFKVDSWAAVRQQFLLQPDYIHMALMLLASHPKPVRDAIDYHRKMLDANPCGYWESNYPTMEDSIAQSVGKFFDVDPKEIALTDSTTMGLAMLYNGFRITENDEILTTVHDHYATEKSLEFAAAKNNATIRRITLYEDSAKTNVDEIVTALTNAITSKTKLVAVTWVHSCSGVKLPIKAMTDAVKAVSEKQGRRIYFAVDGVHGTGIENFTMKDLGCDFFVASTHKWMFGPRGTGIIWAKKDTWNQLVPTIPAFSNYAYGMWLGMVPEGKIPFGDWCTPGGFHSFEHRWALPKAFEFHTQIGRDKIESRSHELSTLLKNNLKEMKNITLHTPVSPSLSAAINCFEVAGFKDPDKVVAQLHEKKIIASSSPYRVSYVRLTPCILNTEDEVQTCLKALQTLKA